MVLPQYVSSTINLYDEISKTLDYTLKVRTEKITVDTTKSYEISASAIKFTNTNGSFVNDLVSTVLNIQSKSDTDRVYVDERDHLIQDQIVSESASRQDADTFLQSAVDSEVASRIAAVNLEILNRSAGDTLIQMNLDAESILRTDADSALTSSIKEKETAIYSTIDTNKTDIEAALATEVSARTAAVSSEETARSNADLTLSGRINQEAVDRANAVTVQQLRIDTLISGSSINLDQLQELVANYNTLNTDALAQVASVLAVHNQLQADFTDLKSRFDALTLN